MCYIYSTKHINHVMIMRNLFLPLLQKISEETPHSLHLPDRLNYINKNRIIINIIKKVINNRMYKVYKNYN